MAEAVVEHLESVEIDEQHRGGRVVALAPGDHRFQLAQHPAAIGDRHQRVEMGEPVELDRPCPRAARPRPCSRAISSSNSARYRGARGLTSCMYTSHCLSHSISQNHGQCGFPIRRVSRIAPPAHASLGPPLLKRQQGRHDGRSACRDHHGQHVRLGDDAPRRRDARRARQSRMRRRVVSAPPHPAAALRLCRGARRSAG